MKELGVGLGAGLLFGVWLKTGVDASPEGVTTTMLETLDPLAPQLHYGEIAIVLSIMGLLALAKQILLSLMFGIGFVIGVALVAQSGS